MRETRLKHYYEKVHTDFVNGLEVIFPGPRRMRIAYRGGENLFIERIIAGVYDLIFIISYVLRWYIVEVFDPFFIAPWNLAVFFPDSRAGIFRTTLRPYIVPALLMEGLYYQDTVLASLYSKLAQDLDNKRIKLDIAEYLLNELGCYPEAVFEHGTYTIYVNMWTGNRLPLYKAPSGIREILLTILALTSENEPYVVIIEEPEAHLHPRAQYILARVIARAINELGKTVILTTHSDIILYSLENLTMASELHEKAKEKLGLDESEILDPNKVVVYLVRPDGTKAVVERLEVTSRGIPEEEFAKVTEELAGERAKILLLSEKRASLSQQS